MSSTAPNKNDLVEKVNNFYRMWQKLRPDSDEKDFTAFGDLFSSDCVAWLCSMREWEDPCRGRQAVIDYVTDNVKIYYFEGREILSESISLDNKKATVESKNRMNLMGRQTVDNMYETAIAEFDGEGLIKSIKIYACRSPLAMVMQGVSGLGPYSDAFHKLEWEHFLANGGPDKSGKAAGLGSILEVSRRMKKGCCI